MKAKTIEMTVQFSQGGDKVTFTNLRMAVSVLGGNQGFQGACTATIWGLPKSTMNRLTTIGVIQQSNKLNKISIAAGEKDGVLTEVFSGIIDTGVRYIQQPEAMFIIQAHTALDVQLTPVKATTYRGSTEVALILGDLCKDAGLRLNNINVNGARLDNPYLHGDTIKKINAVCRAAQLQWDLNNRVLTIWRGQPLRSQLTVAAAGAGDVSMIGTPRETGTGVEIKTLFEPSFQFSKAFKLVSKDVPTASGEWTPFSIEHYLESEMPHGLWETRLGCSRAFA